MEILRVIWVKGNNYDKKIFLLVLNSQEWLNVRASYISLFECYNVDKKYKWFGQRTFNFKYAIPRVILTGDAKNVYHILLDMGSIFNFYVSKNHIFHSKYLHLYQFHIGRLFGKLFLRFSYHQMTNLRKM